MPKPAFYADTLPPVLLAGGELGRAELVAWFQSEQPALPLTTIDWRLHELVRDGRLVRRGRGRYALAGTSQLPIFRPSVPEKLAELWAGLTQKTGEATGCIWTTAWLHDWMRHQPTRAIWLVEVPRASLTTAFYALIDQGVSSVFLEPDASTTARYVVEAARPVVVQSLVSRAPVQVVAGVPVPRLEKLLVDVFTDSVRLTAYQGAELRRLFTTSLRLYACDRVTLWAYAARRGQVAGLQAWAAQDDDLLQTLMPLPSSSAPA